MFSIVIKNGHVVDGTGKLGFDADIGIKDGRIIKIGRITKAQGERIIDASGFVVCPGFIDTHTHSDIYLLINPLCESKIRQGVTTEVIGNCGSSLSPLTRERIDAMKSRYGSLANEITWDWSSMNDYLNKLERQGIALNVIALVGHGTIRTIVMGYENRGPTPSEMEKMKSLVKESMQDGAFGMSSGLVYVPGAYSETEELIALCKVVAEYGGIYTTHTRSETENLWEGTLEAIEIGELAGVPVHISHNVGHIMHPQPTGRCEINLKIIEEARSRGLDVTCDVYSYSVSGTGLKALIPPWAHEGGDESLVKRLKDPEIREKIKKETLERGARDGGSACRALEKAGLWDRITLSNCEKNTDLIGKSFAEIAKLRKVDPFDALFDLLIEEQAHASTTARARWEEEVEIVFKHPTSMFGSDGSSLSPYGVLGVGKNHPRSYGNHSKVLGHYVRERKILTLEEAIRKMTSFPAQRFGISDRGIIKEGTWADIVIFDKDRIVDKATFEQPYQYPEGINYVLVNGKVVIEDGVHTKNLAGKALRHKLEI